MRTSRGPRFACALAAVAGFVDAACYLALHRLFVAHVTGDTNLLGQRLGRGDLAGAVPLAVVIVFFPISVMAGTIGIEVATRHGVRSPLAPALLVEAALLVFVMLYGSRLYRHGTIPGRSALGYYAVLVASVTAVGLQATAFTKCGKRAVRTTYVSGMATRLGQELANVVMLPPRPNRRSYLRDELGLESRRRSADGALLYGSLVFAFMAGASLAVYCELQLALWALAIPVAALVLLAGFGVDRNGKKIVVRSKEQLVATTPTTVPLRRPLEARVFLQPVAAPSVLGSFALASGLLIYGTWVAGAWGDAAAPKSFFPFILLFSGFGELGAAMWAFRARDAVAASIFGAWAAFWLGWGVMWILALAGAIDVPPLGTPFASLGQWFIYMAVISWTTALAALARSPGRFLAQALLGTSSAIAAGAFIAGSPGWEHTAGWLFFASACLFFYIGAATMLDNVYGVVVLPLLEWRRGANRPGSQPFRPVQWEQGEPGVKVGQ